jgi:hypothetical protein
MILFELMGDVKSGYMGIPAEFSRALVCYRIGTCSTLKDAVHRWWYYNVDSSGQERQANNCPKQLPQGIREPNDPLLKQKQHRQCNILSLFSLDELSLS